MRAVPNGRLNEPLLRGAGAFTTEIGNAWGIWDATRVCTLFESADVDATD